MSMRRIAVWKVLLWLVWFPCSCCRDSAGDLLQQDVFIAGQQGYHTYRIPSLIVTRKGTLLAFCEGRKHSASDSGDIDLVMKRSTDGGRTWGHQQLVWDGGPNTCGNPCPVVDQTTGTVWLLLTHNLGEDRESQIKTKTGKGTRTVWVSQSRDDGESWTQPVNVTSSVKDPAWGWYATGPGIGIQIGRGPHQGRLVVPCDHSYSSPEEPGRIDSASHVIYSDDHGESWHIGGVVGPGMNECQLVELAAGKLLLSMRNDPKGTHRAFATSDDAGAHWTEPQHDLELIDPTCQASLIRYSWPNENRPGAILFSNPVSHRREKLTVRIRRDDGTTWDRGLVLNEGSSAYSCLAVLPTGEAACLYERGERTPYEKITLARFLPRLR